jgi:hypothetical protein
MKKEAMAAVLFASLAMTVSGCPWKKSSKKEERIEIKTDRVKAPKYSPGKIDEPALVAAPPAYSYVKTPVDRPEYALPLKDLPENYERDLVEKLKLELGDEKKHQLLSNGVTVVPGDMTRFDGAYGKLANAWAGKPHEGERGVPVFVTTDSVLHLFHIVFNELLKSIEIQQLRPLLSEFLERTLEETVAQYNGIEDEGLKELSRRNISRFMGPAKARHDSFYQAELHDHSRRSRYNGAPHGGKVLRLRRARSRALCPGRLHR